jgi:putative protease
MDPSLVRQGAHASKPELLLPAGSFDAAIAALEGGADALYLGFQSFSARKQARNFDREEYRRLLHLARGGGKRLYVTLNTVIDEGEFPSVDELLGFLCRFPPDAVIFQDWGLASHIHGMYPHMALHASTQTAIQTVAAARIAAEKGVSRIVLPRECGLSDLERFVREVPGMEFEVFVHGALCYSFSGLCLASGLLLGRSGNRGECAQVCRSYYRRGDGPSGYWFSCRDLSLVDEVKSLAAAGAASFKVEGRMKSPEYAHAVARLYRAAIDAAAGGTGSGGSDIPGLLEAARVAFARSPTRGYLRDGRGEGLIDAAWPGHRGAKAGTVLESRRGKALVELSSPLGLRDGLLAFDGPEGDNGEGRPREALQFPVTELADGRTGKPLVTAPRGSLVELSLPAPLAAGTELRRISSREADRRKLSPEEYPAEVESVAAILDLEAGPSGHRLRLSLQGPAFGGLIPMGGSMVFSYGEGLAVEAAKAPGGFLRALSLFAESGTADFRLVPRLGEGRVSVASVDLPLADVFVPPSLLKKAKNALYAEIGGWLVRSTGRADASLSGDGDAAAGQPPSRRPAPRQGLADTVAHMPAPLRHDIALPSDLLSGGLPFLTESLLSGDLSLPLIGGIRWLPLSPLVSDWPAYESAVETLVRKVLASGEKVLVGVDALHHLPLADRLCALDPSGAGLAFFGDIHLYCANASGLHFWLSLLPRLAFIYANIESRSPSSFADPEWLRDPGDGRNAPLFMSKGCHVRHTVAGGSCPDGCTRRYSLPLSDRDRRYRVVVDGCVTLLFREAALHKKDA